MEECDKNDLLYIFVFGEKELLDAPFIGILSPEIVKRVVEKINSLDLIDYIKNFDQAEFERMDIYPDIWLREKREDLISCLVDSFNCLAEFYNEVGRNNKGIIMSIS